MAGLRLGIDVGTSNTVAMLQRPDGSVRPLLFDGSPLLPSAVYPDEHGEVQVGRAALRAARLDPARLEPNPKRRVDEGAVLLGERPWPVHQLLGALLRRVRGEAVRIAGSAPSSLVLTVPASWAAPRRSVLADAAREAGMPEPELVPEPVAAAAHFAGTLDRPAVDGECLVVYDLGAGTFDVAAVAREAGGYRVLAADGLTDLGGLDLDQLVVDHVGRLVASHDAALWQRLTQPADGLWRRRFRDLWDECRAAKEALSSTSSTMVLVPGWDREVLVTRTEFERAASGLLARTVQLTESVMDVAGVDRHRLTVLLVGGGTRVPLVATLLHRALHLPPVVLDQPELVVAEGALRAPAMRAPVHAGVPEAVTAAEAVPGPAPEPAPEAVPAPTVVPEPAPEPETVPLAGVEPAEAVNGLDPVRRPGRDRRVVALAVAVVAAILVAGFLLARHDPSGSGSPQARTSSPAASPSPAPPFVVTAAAKTATFDKGADAVAVRPDGRLMAAADGRSTRLWDLTNHGHPRALATIPVSARVDYSLAFSPDGRMVAAADNGYDAAGTNGAQLWSVADPAHPALLASLSGAKGSVAFSPDGRSLAVDYGRLVRLWRLTDPHHPTLAATFTGHTGGILQVAFSPDGALLAATASDRHTLLWRLTDPAHPVANLTSTGADTIGVVFSPARHLLLIRTLGGASLWDVTQPAHPARLGEISGYGLCAGVFSPDGYTLAGATCGEQGLLYDMRNPAEPGLSAELSDTGCVAFGPDGRTVVTGGYQHLALWSLTGFAG